MDHKNDNSIEGIKQKAMTGDLRAHFQLAHLYETGAGVPRNDILAYAHYYLAEEGNIPGAEISKNDIALRMGAGQFEDAERVIEGLKHDIEKEKRAEKMRRDADSATIRVAGHTSEVDPKAGMFTDVASVTFTFKVYDATEPSRSLSQQWTLTQSVDHLLDRETLNDVQLKAAHLLQRKLRRLADQLDPNLPCRSCSILSAKKK